MADLKKISQELKNLSAEDLQMVSKFIEAIRSRNSSEMYVLSESSLAKDWLRPEEDEAWKDL